MGIADMGDGLIVILSMSWEGGCLVGDNLHVGFGAGKWVGRASLQLISCDCDKSQFMHSYLNTPLQLPIPILSPLFTAKQNYPSPFISPYNGPHDNYYLNKEQDLSDNEFDNFQLDENQDPQPIESEVKPIESPPSISVKSIREMNQDSDEQSVFSQQNCEAVQRIKKIITVLIKHADKNEQRLHVEREKCLEGDSEMGEVFDVLVKKFKKLKKTKEQMTKYCMRKAFKFLGEKHKKILEGKDSGDFLKEYFEKVEGESFSIPFKKNSEEKTMNTNFLKKVFSSPNFLSDYKQFLKSFAKAVDDDNNKKIRYLASTIRVFLEGGSIKKLESVKRLPWTQSILERTIDLANKLVNHSIPDLDDIDFDEKSKKGAKPKSAPQGSPSTRRKSTTTSITDNPTTGAETQERPLKKHG